MEELTLVLFVFNICSAGMLGFLLLFADSTNHAANRYAASGLLLTLACGALAIMGEVVGKMPDLPANMLEFNLGLTGVIMMVMYGYRTLGLPPNPWLWALVALDVSLGICCNVADFDWLNVFLWPGLVAIQIFLAINLYRKVVRQKALLMLNHSSLEHRTLTWIGLLFAALILHRSLEMMVVVLTVGLELAVFSEQVWGLPWSLWTISATVEVLIEMVAAGILFWVGRHALGQIPCESMDLLPGEALVTSDLSSPNEHAVDSKQFEEVVHRIRELKAWRKEDLTLRDLALLLDIGEKELSRILNHRPESNFYQLINELRVADFKELMTMQEADDYSIFGLAMEAGFRSKTTFYKAFRAVEGMTPSAYQSNTVKKTSF